MINNLYLCEECHQKFESQESHECKEYNSCCEGNCLCPPPVIKTFEVEYTRKVKIKMHLWVGDGWNMYDTIDECISVWDNGVARIGAHHWDTIFCHIAQNPHTKKYVLLYL